MEGPLDAPNRRDRTALGLTAGELRDRRVRRARAAVAGTIAAKSTRVGHRAIPLGVRYRVGSPCDESAHDEEEAAEAHVARRAPLLLLPVPDAAEQPRAP